MRIEAVIFDMDGLMLDSERYYAEASKKAVAAMGFEPSDDLIRRTVGGSHDNWLRCYREHYGPDFSEEQFRVFCDKEMSYWYQNGIPTKPGLFELLDYLDEQGIPRAVASSTQEAKATQALEKAGVYHRLHQHIFGDQIPLGRGKPNPDIFLEAARRLGVDPAGCMGLEDSINGLRASFAAGLYTVMIPDSIEPNPQLLAHTHHCLPTLAHVIPLLEELNTPVTA